MRAFACLPLATEFICSCADPPPYFTVPAMVEKYARLYHDQLVMRITEEHLEVSLSKQGEELVCWVVHLFSHHLADYMRFFYLVTGHGFGVTKCQVSEVPPRV